jgi:hypothetical protein
MKSYTAIFTKIILGLMFLAIAEKVEAAPSSDNIADVKLLFLQEDSTPGRMSAQRARQEKLTITNRNIRISKRSLQSD